MPVVPPLFGDYVLWPLVSYVQQLYLRLLGASVLALLAGVCAYRTGLFQSFVHRIVEQELRRKLNGARVTIGDLQFNLPTGHITIREAIIHTPDRAKWAWDSPLIFRAGYVHAHCSWLSLVPFPYARMLGFPVRDVYTLEVEDGQMFVEKRGNVFNFHLLDPSLDLPDPGTWTNGAAAGNGGGPSAADAPRGEDGGDGSADPCAEDAGAALLLPTTMTTMLTTAAAGAVTPAKFPRPQGPEKSPSVLAAEKKANEIVCNMLGALSGLTKSLNEGGKDGLERAFKYQRDGFVSKLREFQDANGRKPINLEDLAADGMKVMKHVGRAVEKNVAEIQQQVDALTKPPPKKKGWVSKEIPDRFRIGRIVVRDVRIFVKGLMVEKVRTGSPHPGGGPAPSASAPARGGDGTGQPRATDWNRPIHFREISMGPAELCPAASTAASHAGARPATSGDAGDGAAAGGPQCPPLPPLGLSEKEFLEVLKRRALTELAKTNSGRVLQTAYGEALAWLDQKGTGGSSGAGTGVMGGNGSGGTVGAGGGSGERTGWCPVGNSGMVGGGDNVGKKMD